MPNQANKKQKVYVFILLNGSEDINFLLENGKTSAFQGIINKFIGKQLIKSEIDYSEKETISDNNLFAPVPIGEEQLTDKIIESAVIDPNDIYAQFSAINYQNLKKIKGRGIMLLEMELPLNIIKYDVNGTLHSPFAVMKHIPKISTVRVSSSYMIQNEDINGLLISESLNHLGLPKNYASTYSTFEYNNPYSVPIFGSILTIPNQYKYLKEEQIIYEKAINIFQGMLQLNSQSKFSNLPKEIIDNILNKIDNKIPRDRIIKVIDHAYEVVFMKSFMNALEVLVDPENDAFWFTQKNETTPKSISEIRAIVNNDTIDYIQKYHLLENLIRQNLLTNKFSFDIDSKNHEQRLLKAVNKKSLTLLQHLISELNPKKEQRSTKKNKNNYQQTLISPPSYSESKTKLQFFAA